MDPFTIGAIAAPVVGSIAGNIMGADARRDADNKRNQALAQFLGLTVPDIEKMKLQLDQQTSVGQIDPQLQALFELGPSALENVSTDPRLRAQQMKALEDIAGIAGSGLSQADAAAFELAKRDASAYDTAKQAQLLQEMQQRGMGGSGQELIARTQASQSAADRLQQAGLEQAKLQQQARMQALQQQAGMAQQLRQQDYNEAANAAQAQDAIARFNTQSKQNQNASNVSIANNAQMQNLNNAQQIANNNVSIRNQQQQHNKGLIQQDYQNRYNLASAKANALTGSANASDQRASQTAGMWAGVGQGLGTGFAGIAQNNVNQANADRQYALNKQVADSYTDPNQPLNNKRYNPNGF